MLWQDSISARIGTSTCYPLFFYFLRFKDTRFIIYCVCTLQFIFNHIKCITTHYNTVLYQTRFLHSPVMHSVNISRMYTYLYTRTLERIAYAQNQQGKLIHAKCSACRKQFSRTNSYKNRYWMPAMYIVHVCIRLGQLQGKILRIIKSVFLLHSFSYAFFILLNAATWLDFHSEPQPKISWRVENKLQSIWSATRDQTGEFQNLWLINGFLPSFSNVNVMQYCLTSHR